MKLISSFISVSLLFLLGGSSSYAATAVPPFDAPHVLAGVANYFERMEVKEGVLSDAWIIEPVAPGAAKPGHYHPWNRRAWLIQQQNPGVKVVYSPEALDLLGANAGFDENRKIFLMSRDLMKNPDQLYDPRVVNTDIYINRFETFSIPHEWTHYVYFTSNRDHPLLGQIRAVGDTDVIGPHEGYRKFLDLTEHATFTQMFANYLSAPGLGALQTTFKNQHVQKQKLLDLMTAKEREFMKSRHLEGGSLADAIAKLDDPGDRVTLRSDFDKQEGVSELSDEIAALDADSKYAETAEKVSILRAQVEMYGQMVASSRKRAAELAAILREGNWASPTLDPDASFRTTVSASGNRSLEVRIQRKASGYGFDEGFFESILTHEDGSRFRYSFQFRGVESLKWVDQVVRQDVKSATMSTVFSPVLNRLKLLDAGYRDEAPLIAQFTSFMSRLETLDWKSPATMKEVAEMKEKLSHFWASR